MGGLYGERTGALHFVCNNKADADRLLSQIKIIVRSNYSSPPKHGARIASIILNEPAMRAQWFEELIAVTKRINEMRLALRASLEKIQTPGDWSHITTQIGMFSFAGLTLKQSVAMVEKHHVYMTKNAVSLLRTHHCQRRLCRRVREGCCDEPLIVSLDY